HQNRGRTFFLRPERARMARTSHQPSEKRSSSFGSSPKPHCERPSSTRMTYVARVYDAPETFIKSSFALDPLGPLASFNPPRIRRFNWHMNSCTLSSVSSWWCYLCEVRQLDPETGGIGHVEHQSSRRTLARCTAPNW